MAETQIKDKRHRHYYLMPVKKMRLLLMACAILYTYGIHTFLGDLSGVLLGFSFPALYIISGYIVLRKSKNIEKRILRAIGRAAVCLVIMFAISFVLSMIADAKTTLTLVTSKAFWFDFIVFNVCSLPIGSMMWYVQALLYAYIAIFIVYKLKMLKLDIYIAVACLVVTLLTGELSRVVGFEFLWHTYLGGNFITRAIPYILIGCFIHRKRRFFKKYTARTYSVVVLFGVVLTFAEYLWLSLTDKKLYVGHLLGMGFVAVGIVSACFFSNRMKIRSKSIVILTRNEMMIPFFICSPIYYILLWSFGDLPLQYLGFIGIVTALLSFAALYAYGFICLLIMRSRMKKIKAEIAEKNKPTEHRSPLDTKSDELAQASKQEFYSASHQESHHESHHETRERLHIEDGQKLLGFYSASREDSKDKSHHESHHGSHHESREKLPTEAGQELLGFYSASRKESKDKQHHESHHGSHHESREKLPTEAGQELQGFYSASRKESKHGSHHSSHHESREKLPTEAGQELPGFYSASRKKSKDEQHHESHHESHHSSSHALPDELTQEAQQFYSASRKEKKHKHHLHRHSHHKHSKEEEAQASEFIR